MRIHLCGLAFCLWASLLSCAHAGQVFHFSNFDTDIDLVASGNQYTSKKIHGSVTLTNRLIIKTTPAFTRNNIRTVDDRIHKVTELYTGNNFLYFLVELEHKSDLRAVARIFEGRPGILLVQPDILQTRLTSLSSASLHIHHANSLPVYLDKLPIRNLRQQTRGKGIKLAIIDDGIDLSHPALSHVNLEFAYDTESRQLNAQPHSPGDNHGTLVAGIIFAREGGGAANHKLDGIAPDAQLIAIRQPDTWTSNTLLAFHLAQLNGADIINCSWHTGFLLQPVADVVYDLAQHGRKGKGTAVIFSAGNQGQLLTNFSTEATIDAAITVGALDAGGGRLASSNFGAGVDVHAYGAGVQSTANNHSYHHFSGTSLSAAIVSGTSALLLGREPEMTLIDLVSALRKINGDINGAINGEQENSLANANDNTITNSIRNPDNVNAGIH